MDLRKRAGTELGISRERLILAAIVARGAGEYLMEQVLRMTEEIQ